MPLLRVLANLTQRIRGAPPYLLIRALEGTLADLDVDDAGELIRTHRRRGIDAALEVGYLTLARAAAVGRDVRLTAQGRTRPHARGAYQTTVHPPSMTRHAPVMKAERSDTRK